MMECSICKAPRRRWERRLEFRYGASEKLKEICYECSDGIYEQINGKRKYLNPEDCLGPCVYFYLAPELRRVKIGFTANRPIDRRHGIQNGCPDRLRFLFALSGDEKKEARLHRVFSSARIVGEWFHYKGDLRKYIDASIKVAAWWSRFQEIEPEGARLWVFHTTSPDRYTMPRLPQRVTA